MSLQKPQNESFETLSLEQAATLLLEECRMVLPGIQALFGFQFVAVFNAGFTTRLSPLERDAHLVALMCVLVAAALVLAPAAIHRTAQPRSVSSGFLRMSSALLMGSMPPLAVGTMIDVVLVAHIITGNQIAAFCVGGVALIVFVSAWMLLPAIARRRFASVAPR